MTLPGLLTHFGIKYLFDIGAKELVAWVEQRFADSSAKLPAAILTANLRTWQVVALGVGDDTFGTRVRDLVRDGDLKAARELVRSVVADTPNALGLSPADLRGRAAAELAALRAGPSTASVESDDVLRRYADPAGLAADAVRAAADVPTGLAAPAPHLAAVLRLAPGGGPGLFESLFRHFLRAAVAKDDDLARRFGHAQLDALTAALDARTAGILGQIDVLFDALDAGFAGVNDKLDANEARLRDIQETLAAPRKPGVSYDCDDMREYLLRAKADFLRGGGRVRPEQWGLLGDALREARLYSDAADAHTTAAATAHAARDTAAEAANQYKA
ncbi:MAG TPA: hypothetical protein VH092_21530, partial [Urbifossiella sp.]|nr:hypothetical protein [Urbifossiella sp.]